MEKTILKFITALLFTISFNVNGQESRQDAYKRLTKYAMDLYNEGEYQKSKEHFLAAFEIFSSNKIDLYNGACSSSLSGDFPTALELLKESLLNGYDNPDHMEKDKDLCSLKFNPEWERLVGMAKNNEQQEENTIKKISQHINNQNLEGIWEMTSDSFKLKYKKEKLAKPLKKIKELMEVRKNYNLNNLKNQNVSRNFSFVNGVETNNLKYTFRFFPDYYGSGTNDWMKPNLGDKFELSFIYKKNSILLDEFSYENAYTESTFDFLAYLKDFLQFTETYTVKINAITKSGDETNLIQHFIKKKGVDESRLMNILDITKYIPEEEISNQEENLKRMSLILEKKTPLDSTELKKQKDPLKLFSKTKTLAFIVTFILDNSNQVILATKDKYAFFEIKDKNALKEFCIKHLDLP